MKIIGIICEYNPLHLGHKKQFDTIRSANPDCSIVCLMSGNYVQRGEPAIFDKMLRAQAAIACGADLVLELPIPVALSSAEGFAQGGVSILSKACDSLCFGAENAQAETLWQIAGALLRPEFSPILKEELETGVSFPAARQKALERMGVCADILAAPNNILAVEYCKAILSQNSAMEIMPILRQGNYHGTLPDAENPSATFLRQQFFQKQDWQSYVPEPVREIFAGGNRHCTAFGERSVLTRLRTMTDEEFEALPYGSEGLWRKLMHASRQFGTLEEIIAAVKSKRYTRTRLDRMVLCAYLGITQKTLTEPVPYVRALAFNDKGRDILKEFRTQGEFPNIGEIRPEAYQLLENRCTDLYGLFAEVPEPPSREEKYRVYYEKNGET